MTKIVVSHWVHDEVLDQLGLHGEVVSNPTRESLAPEELAFRCRDADALMAFMPDRIDAAFLNGCPKLRIVAGAFKGHDNVDVAECARRGVWVSVVPDLLTGPTAELAVGLALALIRKILEGDAHVRSGGFSGWRPTLYGGTLEHARVGIFGMGKLGRAIAKRLAGFDALIRHHDPSSPDSVPFDELVTGSDVLFVSAPLTPETLHRIDARALSELPPGAVIVNVGRGSVADEQAIAEALSAGRLGGYAADVFEMEDLSREGHPDRIPADLLRIGDRTVFTPHLGSAVDRARREIALSTARSIAEALQGQTPSDAVNDPRAAASRSSV